MGHRVEGLRPPSPHAARAAGGGERGAGRARLGRRERDGGHDRASREARALERDSGLGVREVAEQQRLAFARALLQRPDWLFLDEATSGLDEESETRLYEALRVGLPHAAVVSIADRPSLGRHHARHWTLTRHGEAMALHAA